MSGDGRANGTANGVRRAPEPLELFTGLAAMCVPAFCDGLRLNLRTDDGRALDVSYPLGEPVAVGKVPPADSSAEHNGNPLLHHADGADGEAPTNHATGPGRVVVTVRSEPVAGEPAIAGTITCSWSDEERPSAQDLAVARIVASQVVAKTRIASLIGDLREQRSRAANLEEALATNREIGQAIGILMATEHLTAEQAFDVLRTASQHSHRKLRAIAADVVETGTLTEAAASAPARTPIGIA